MSTMIQIIQVITVLHFQKEKGTTGEMEQWRCSSNSDPVYQVSLAHLPLPFVILFFWGYTFTGKEYKKLLQKETGKVLTQWARK